MYKVPKTGKDCFRRDLDLSDSDAGRSELPDENDGRK